jgi:uncharacterized RDD family membrane protein YckC
MTTIPTTVDEARREIVTPEGIPISFTLAPITDRFLALMIDLAIQAVIVFVVVVLAVVSLAGSFFEGSWLIPIVIIALFLVQNFYFPFFEVRWQGSTPGKRRLKLRVIDARGGQLEASSVLARNLIRELELWMPIRFIIGGSMIWPDAPPWMRLVAGGWTVIFLIFPVLNKDRLRTGDLIAGTRVVIQPQTILAPDLAADPGIAPPAPALYPTAAAAAPKPRAAPAFTFTDEQLNIYGELELKTLENLLRDTGAGDRLDKLSLVAEKIQTKIGYSPRVPFSQEERFLRDFYTALRAHLEKRLLFGKRKADKTAK